MFQWLYDFIPPNTLLQFYIWGFAKQTRKLLSTLSLQKLSIEKSLFSWADHFAEAYPGAEREGGGGNYKYYCSLLVGYNDSDIFFTKNVSSWRLFFNSFERVLLKLCQKCYISKQIIFKHSKWLYKNKEFDSDCESIFFKVTKIFTKRLGQKHFHIYFFITLPLVTFCNNFYSFSMDSKPAWNSSFLAAILNKEYSPIVCLFYLFVHIRFFFRFGGKLRREQVKIRVLE